MSTKNSLSRIVALPWNIQETDDFAAVPLDEGYVPSSEWRCEINGNLPDGAITYNADLDVEVGMRVYYLTSWTGPGSKAAANPHRYAGEVTDVRILDDYGIYTFRICFENFNLNAGASGTPIFVRNEDDSIGHIIGFYNGAGGFSEQIGRCTLIRYALRRLSEKVNEGNEGTPFTVAT